MTSQTVTDQSVRDCEAPRLISRHQRQNPKHLLLKNKLVAA